MSSGDIDMLTGLPRQLSKGQLAKAEKGKKPAETTQQTKTDDKKPTVSIVLTIEEEDNDEDGDDIPKIDDAEAERLSKILEAFKRKKEKTIQQKKLEEAAKLQEDRKKAAEEIAELQKKREEATKKISLLRDEIAEIDGTIASLNTQFPDLDPTQANNDSDSEDDDVSVGGADIRPTPTAKTASKKAPHLDENWQVVSSFAGKTAMTIPQKETGKQIASSGAVKILEIDETETKQQKLEQFYISVFPNGKKPCINAYVYCFLELLLAFEHISFNPSKGCQKTIEECGLCKNHNLKGFFKKVEIADDKFFKCLNLFNALLNSTFKFYGVNTTIDQYNFYKKLVDSFQE